MVVFGSSSIATRASKRPFDGIVPEKGAPEWSFCMDAVIEDGVQSVE